MLRGQSHPGFLSREIKPHHKGSDNRSIKTQRLPPDFPSSTAIHNQDHNSKWQARLHRAQIHIDTSHQWQRDFIPKLTNPGSRDTYIPFIKNIPDSDKLAEKISDLTYNHLQNIINYSQDIKQDCSKRLPNTDKKSSTDFLQKLQQNPAFITLKQSLNNTTN